MTNSKMKAWDLGSPSYTISVRLPQADFEEAVERTIEALKTEGFGVLTEIDLQGTLKKKLDVDVPKYRILGACNPPLAYKAVSVEPGIGALLPCNVIVAQEEEAVFVGAIHPTAMFSVVERPEVAPLAAEVAEKLERALASLS